MSVSIHLTEAYQPLKYYGLVYANRHVSQCEIELHLVKMAHHSVTPYVGRFRAVAPCYWKPRDIMLAVSCCSAVGSSLGFMSLDDCMT